MANEQGQYKIKLVSEADLKGSREMQNAIDQTTVKIKGLEEATKKANAAIAQSSSASNTGSGLATGTGGIFGGKKQKTAKQLQAEEKAAGLRTERSMKLEDDEAERRLAAKARFLQDTGAQRGKLASDIEGAKAGLPDAGTIAKIFGTLTAAVYGAARAVREYAKDQEAAAKVEATLAQRGQNIDSYRKHIHNLAEEMASRTGADKGSWLDAISQLTQSGAGPDSIDQLAKSVENLAGRMGGNLQAASLALSKALNGNFDALRRAGVVIPETGTQAEKLAAAFKGAEKGAGVLAAMAQTLGGKFNNLQNESRNVFSEVGRLIAGIFQLPQLMDIASKGAKKLADAMGGAVPPTLGLNNALDDSNRALLESEEAAKRAAAQYNSISEASNRATESLNRQANAQRQILDAQNQVADSKLQLEMAQIDFGEASGQLTPQQARARRAGANLRSASGRFQREQAADSESIRANERRINREGNLLGLAQGREASLSAEDQRQQEAVRARAAVGNAENELHKAEQALNERRSALMAGAAASGGQVGVMAGGGAIDPSFQRNVETARAALDAARGNAARFGSNLNDENATTTATELAQTRNALIELTTTIRNVVPGLRDTNSGTRLRMDTRAEVMRTNEAAEAFRNLTSAIEDVNRRMGNR